MLARSRPAALLQFRNCRVQTLLHVLKPNLHLFCATTIGVLSAAIGSACEARAPVRPEHSKMAETAMILEFVMSVSFAPLWCISIRPAKHAVPLIVVSRVVLQMRAMLPTFTLRCSVSAINFSKLSVQLLHSLELSPVLFPSRNRQVARSQAPRLGAGILALSERLSRCLPCTSAKSRLH